MAPVEHLLLTCLFANNTNVFPQNVYNALEEESTPFIGDWPKTHRRLLTFLKALHCMNQPMQALLEVEQYYHTKNNMVLALEDLEEELRDEDTLLSAFTWSKFTLMFVWESENLVLYYCIEEKIGTNRTYALFYQEIVEKLLCEQTSIKRADPNKLISMATTIVGGFMANVPSSKEHLLTIMPLNAKDCSTFSGYASIPILVVTDKTSKVLLPERDKSIKFLTLEQSLTTSDILLNSKLLSEMESAHIICLDLPVHPKLFHLSHIIPEVLILRSCLDNQISCHAAVEAALSKGVKVVLLLEQSQESLEIVEIVKKLCQSNNTCLPFTDFKVHLSRFQVKFFGKNTTLIDLVCPWETEEPLEKQATADIMHVLRPVTVGKSKRGRRRPKSRVDARSSIRSLRHITRGYCSEGDDCGSQTNLSDYADLLKNEFGAEVVGVDL